MTTRAHNDPEFRAWARENCERARAACEEPTDCGHAGHAEYSTCVVCAWHLGRTEGEMNAGAYLTHAEMLRFVDVFNNLKPKEGSIEGGANGLSPAMPEVGPESTPSDLDSPIPVTPLSLQQQSKERA